MTAIKLIVCLVVMMAVVHIHAAKVPEKFTAKYDNLNLDEILNSDRLLGNYTKCLLDKGKCTPDGAELKKNLPDALNNNCAKCTKKQKEESDRVMRHLINKKPATYALLEQKFDPTGTYKKKYADELKSLKA